MALLPIPFNNPRTYAGHSGVDYGQPLGTPFRASGPGKVVTRSYNSRGGYFVWVQYDNGPKVGYHHMDSHRGVPAVGARVSLGSLLGYVGNTGNSTGPHLHSEVAGYATTAGYWRFFDRNRVVGQAAPSTAGGADDMNLTSRPVKDIQRLVGVTADGIWGPKTTAAVKAWQTGKRLTADGIWGALSDAVGFPIVVDGDWGDKTTAKLQATLAVPVDGERGPQTTKAFQNAVGITADGDWGPATTKALQKQVGVTVDGDIGPKTVTALQVFLNAGKKFVKPTAPTPTPTPTPTTDPVAGYNATMRPLEQIQTFLKVTPTGVWNRETSDAVAAFQTAQGITVDRIWGVTSDGLAFPPAGSIHGVDYSFARPDPNTLAARGVKLAGRYLWRDKYDDGRTNKGINAAELGALTAAGIDVFFIYEEDGKELLGGFAAGVRVATAAETFRIALGVGAVPIYFNVDYDAPATDMPKILDALRGVASVIGLERVGLYAGFGPIKAAFDAGLIRWGFQTYAWSGGKWDPRAQLQQWSNGQWGGTVDFTRAVVAEYGQNPVTDPDPPTGTVVITKAELMVLRAELDAAVAVATKLSAQLGRWLG